MIENIIKIKDFLMSIYLEREEIIHGILVAFVARQHVLLVGPPGTAKSALVADLAKCVTGTNYFQWLLTRFSTPEELFGPISLKALEMDTYQRNTQGKLPEANVAFVDEIFKANSAILNSLLTLANERLFYNNGGIVPSPLFSIVGASNEWPEEGEGLEALFDRFMLRYEVASIRDGQNFVAMLRNTYPSRRPAISLEELEQLQQYSETMVALPGDILEVLRDIRSVLRLEGIRPSDRRFRQSLSLLKAAATLDGRTVVTREDLSILVHVLWTTPEDNERKIVRRVLQDYCLDPLERELVVLSETVFELAQKIDSTDLSATQEALEFSQKIKSLRIQTENILSQNTLSGGGNETAQRILNLLDEKKKQLAAAVLGM